MEPIRLLFFRALPHPKPLNSANPDAFPLVPFVTCVAGACSWEVCGGGDHSKGLHHLPVPGAGGAKPLLLFSRKRMKPTFYAIVPQQVRLLIGRLASIFKEVCNDSLEVRSQKGRGDFTSSLILLGNCFLCYYCMVAVCEGANRGALRFGGQQLTSCINPMLYASIPVFPSISWAPMNIDSVGT